MFFIKYDYMLTKLWNIVLETITNVIFKFNSSFLITTQIWSIHFYFVNFVHISRTITYNKYQQKNGAFSALKIPDVAEDTRSVLFSYSVVQNRENRDSRLWGNYSSAGETKDTEVLTEDVTKWRSKRIKFRYFKIPRGSESN